MTDVKLHDAWSAMDKSVAMALWTVQAITEELQDNEVISTDNYFIVAVWWDSSLPPHITLHLLHFSFLLKKTNISTTDLQLFIKQNKFTQHQ